jgi:hypothetical protein
LGKFSKSSLPSADWPGMGEARQYLVPEPVVGGRREEAPEKSALGGNESNHPSNSQIPVIRVEGIHHGGAEGTEF